MVYKKGGGFPMYFFIFGRGWLKLNSVKVYGGGLEEGGGLQERIRYMVTSCLANHSANVQLNS